MFFHGYFTPKINFPTEKIRKVYKTQQSYYKKVEKKRKNILRVPRKRTLGLSDRHRLSHPKALPTALNIPLSNIGQNWLHFPLNKQKQEVSSIFSCFIGEKHQSERISFFSFLASFKNFPLFSQLSILPLAAQDHGYREYSLYSEPNDYCFNNTRRLHHLFQQ